ncbi:MAG: hypothetical protein Tsb0014_05410 [Pleurocapsa sp.]
MNQFHHNYLDSLFSKVAQSWHLIRIYEAIEEIKIQPLSALEKAILRGLLSGYSPSEIKSVCNLESDKSITNIVGQLYSWVDAIKKFPQKPIQNYRDIPLRLAALGYKKTDVTILLNNIDTQVEEVTKSDRDINSRNGQSSASQSRMEDRLKAIDAEIEELFCSDHDIQAKDRQARKNNYSNQKYILPSNDVREPAAAILPSEDRSFTTLEDKESPVINRWLGLGILSIMGLAGVAFVVAAVTPYRVTIESSIKVIPSGELKIVRATATGTIKEIKVKANQPVNQGDIIATIDNSQWEQQKSQLQTDIKQLKLQLGQLTTQSKALTQQIVSETTNIEASITKAEAQFNQSRQNQQNLEITKTAELETAQKNLQSAQQELEKFWNQLNSVKADIATQKAALQQAQTKYKRYQTLAASGALSQEQLKETRLEVERQQQQLTSQQTNIQNYQRAIARQQEVIAAAKARVKNAQSTLNTDDSELETIEQQIEQLRVSGDDILAKIKSDRDSVVQEQTAIQKQLADKQQQLQQLESNIPPSTITAPTTGTIFKLNVDNFGQNVEPDTEIALITPNETSLLIKALVSSQDVSQLSVGKSVKVQLSTCPNSEFGTFQGKITKVNSSITRSDNYLGSKELLSEVNIEPENKISIKPNRSCSWQLGTKKAATITPPAETILEFLLKKAGLMTN